MRPIRLQKQTRIVATIAEHNCSKEFLRQLYEAGVNVIRINTAHASFDGARKIIKDAHDASEKMGIMIDTKGPEIRTTAAAEDQTVLLTEGKKITLDGQKDEPSTSEALHCSYPEIHTSLPPGTIVLIDDGAIELRVDDQIDGHVLCTVINGGEFKGRKSINIPNIHIPLPALTQKDRDFIYLAIEEDIAFIAHSFVRNKNDLQEIQNILDEKQSKIKIISKIENQEGVDNINEILEHSYGIMVARGDLGIEIPAEQIPSIQKQLIKASLARHKPVITATQMMKSMVNNPRPTRAEVNDVANSIYDGTDAVMLSEETAMGKFPLETVQMVTSIAIAAEKHSPSRQKTVLAHMEDSVPNFLSTAAIDAATRLEADSIVIDTKHGRTARAMAAFRGKKPVHCRCYNKRVMRELSLSFGIHTDYMEPKETTDEFIQYALQRLLKKEYAHEDNKVVVVAGNFGPTEEPTFMEISTISDMLRICDPNRKKNR